MTIYYYIKATLDARSVSFNLPDVGVKALDLVRITFRE